MGEDRQIEVIVELDDGDDNLFLTLFIDWDDDHLRLDDGSNLSACVFVAVLVIGADDEFN